MASDCGNVQKVFVPQKDSETSSSDVINGIEITDVAAEKIKLFCEKDGKSSSEYGLHVKVVTDGCSGKSYDMNLAKIEEHQESDKLFTRHGATLIVDKLSYIFVIGSRLDYVETLLMSGFQLNNPNIKKSCSCGSSFAV